MATPRLLTISGNLTVTSGQTITSGNVRPINLPSSLWLLRSTSQPISVWRLGTLHQPFGEICGETPGDVCNLVVIFRTNFGDFW